MGDTGPESPHASLVIEDDVELALMMSAYLTTRGFTIETAFDGTQGLRLALSRRYDLIILDLMLPHLSGMEVLTQLRRRSEVPVIVLTAQAAPESRIAGLEAGADDYLCKPFAPAELVARMRAVLKRAGYPRVRQVLRVGDITLNLSTHRVERAGVLIDLTPHEFNILDLLLRHIGRVVSRDEIVSALYQRESTAFERSVDVHVSHLRKKLERRHESLIRSVRGIGYIFQTE